MYQQKMRPRSRWRAARYAQFLAGLIVLSGCGGSPPTGDAKAVNETCIANGGTTSYCDCTTKELQAKLSPDVFAQVARREAGSDPATLLDIMAAADKACTTP